MKLWTQALAQSTPKLYATEEIPLSDKVVTAKFFALASSWSWYVVEASEPDPNGDITFFGYVDSGGDNSEWGYFQLGELAALRWHSIPRVERDMHFRATRFAELFRETTTPQRKG